MTIMLYDTSALIFLSTLSLRRATRFGRVIDVQFVFLSTLSLRRATIHYDNYNLHCVISIHALLAESDLSLSIFVFWTALFLSTLSLRRATVLVWCSFGGAFDFYPRSPCGERHAQSFPALHHIFISIHALLAESDDFAASRPKNSQISIHALLAESD